MSKNEYNDNYDDPLPLPFLLLSRKTTKDPRLSFGVTSPPVLSDPEASALGVSCSLVEALGRLSRMTTNDFPGVGVVAGVVAVGSSSRASAPPSLWRRFFRTLYQCFFFGCDISVSSSSTADEEARRDLSTTMGERSDTGLEL